MAKIHSYYYLIDRLTSEKAKSLKLALGSIDAVKEVLVKINSGTIEVQATKEVENEIKMACTVSGLTYRMKLKKRQAV